MMLATLFDFPFEDRRKLTRWSDVATAGPETGIVESEEQRRAELMECVEYFMNLWQQRIGGDGHDLITLLANGEETRDMDTMEYLGNLVLLIVGGNDTTRNSMSGSVYGSHLFPAEWEKVRANRDSNSQYGGRDYSLANPVSLHATNRSRRCSATWQNDKTG